jgi:membrane dipeptidase
MGYKTAEEAHDQALKQWDWYQHQIDNGELRLVDSQQALPGCESPAAPPRESPKAIPFVLLLEGADALRSADDVHGWYQRGLRIVGLAWGKTRMAGGTGSPGPLTDEGRAIVRAMDQLHMIHDTSHLADDSFWQLLDLTDGPLMASHSNCRHIVPTDRQLSDDMIKAIARRSGVIGVNLYDEFLLAPDQYKKRPCTLDDLIAHIKRICDLAGSANHLGLGTDMDGGVGRDDIPHELTTIADLPRVADALSAANFCNEDIFNIMGKNWLTFFRRHLP